MQLKKNYNPYKWKKKSFKEKLADTRKVLNTLTFPQKVDHIRTYYSGHIFALVVGILVVIAFIVTFAKATPNAIYISCCDTYCEDQNKAEEYLNQRFNEYLGNTKVKKLLKLDTSLSFRDDLSDYQVHLMEQKFSAEMQAQAIDLFIGNHNTITSFGEIGMFEDLEAVLDPVLFESLKEKQLLFTCTIPADEESDTPELTYYCGIDISKLQPNLFADAGFVIDEDTCLGIPYGSRRLERTLMFINMLF